MNSIQYLKGIHPGLVLEKELKKRGLSKGLFALSIHEYPQILGAVTKGKRKMNTSLALRIEKALGMEEGFFMILQVWHDIKEEKRKQGLSNTPDLKIFRPALFWDTTLDRIDWTQQKKAIIERVFERGTFSEKKEILRFYGKDEVKRVVHKGKSPVI